MSCGAAVERGPAENRGEGTCGETRRGDLWGNGERGSTGKWGVRGHGVMRELQRYVNRARAVAGARGSFATWAYRERDSRTFRISKNL